jgi:hypothetical protein
MRTLRNWGELLAPGLALALAARGSREIGVVLNGHGRIQKLKPDIFTTVATFRKGLSGKDGHLVVKPVLVVQDLIDSRLRSFLPRLENVLSHGGYLHPGKF